MGILNNPASSGSSSDQHGNELHTPQMSLATHDHAGVYDPLGSADAAVTTHEAAANPHAGYVLQSALIDALPVGSVIQESRTTDSDIVALSSTGAATDFISDSLSCAAAGSIVYSQAAVGNYMQVDVTGGGEDAEAYVHFEVDGSPIHSRVIGIKGEPGSSNSRLTYFFPATLTAVYAPGDTNSHTYSWSIELATGSIIRASASASNPHRMVLQEVKQ